MKKLVVADISRIHANQHRLKLRNMFVKRAITPNGKSNAFHGLTDWESC